MQLLYSELYNDRIIFTVLLFEYLVSLYNYILHNNIHNSKRNYLLQVLYSQRGLQSEPNSRMVRGASVKEDKDFQVSQAGQKYCSFYETG